MKHLLTGFFTLWLCLAAQADDIDIYQGQSTGIPNNVMFLMDTSRSMSRWVYFDIGPYDPTFTYPKPINGFDAETYYYGKYVDGDGSSTIETDALLDRFLNKDAIECNGAVETIEQYGVIRGKFKRWDSTSNNWEAPGLITTGLPHGSDSIDATWVCKNDEGNHPGGAYISTRLFDASKYTSNKHGNYERLLGWGNHIGTLFKGNYLNYEIYTKEGSELSLFQPYEDKISRMGLARSAAKHAANTVQGFNLGLARFDVDNNGGFVDLPIGPIATNKAQFNAKIDEYFTYGGTPLSESYFEIARYYRGNGKTTDGSVYFGNNTKSRVKTDTVFRWPSGMVGLFSGRNNSDKIETPSVDESRVGNTGNIYNSPIDSACQSESMIVLFTDGEPQSDSGANAAIKAMIQDASFPTDSGLSKECSGSGGCADELAYYLANHDQSDLPGRQIIRTHVIGGFITDSTGEDNGTGENDDGASNNDLDGIPLLRSIAHHGGGEYFTADSYQDIVDALVKLFGSASETPATFVAPAISTNSYNSLEHQDELYYAMFQPNSGADWQGNLKLYRLGSDGKVMEAGGKAAIDDDDGLIKKDARSYWTPVNNPDGPNVPLGGAAQHLTKEHNIFTHLTTAEGVLTTTIEGTAEMRTLMQIPASMNSEDFTKTVNWANRIDLENTVDGTRKEIEDPLHSRPVVINYSTTVNPTSGEVSADSVVYMASNSGYLHAFKADKETYQEYFSYIPKELLPNITKYVNDGTLRKDQLYGLDGHISYWFKDVNKNGQVDSSDGDKVILYVGMRRGGNHYYALDVTNRNAPKYLWQIDGGTGDFERLGQTWSEMTLAKVPFGDEHKVVLLFGGGYDENEDLATSASSNQLGNAIYMVDALSGDLLWKASKSGHNLNNSEMNASFMNNIRLVDFNGDRITDFFYVSDVAGRIWRFDINKANTGATDFADGGIIFDANGDSSDSAYNRFYNSPSISYFKEESGTGFLTISIGTGFRASPLAPSSEDAFYVLTDYDITNKPASYTKRTPSELAHYSLADNTKSNSVDTNKKNGWKFTLAGTSEKVLADALTTHGRVVFTTFAPNTDPNPGLCSFDLGNTKSYIIKFQDPSDNLPSTETLSCVARGDCPETPPLVPPVAVVVPPCTDPAICPPVCTDPDGCEDEPPKPKCDDGGTVILIGTSKLGETISRCGILEKDYWLER